jgi:hypothetical protein
MSREKDEKNRRHGSVERLLSDASNLADTLEERVLRLEQEANLMRVVTDRLKQGLDR